MSSTSSPSISALAGRATADLWPKVAYTLDDTVPMVPLTSTTNNTNKTKTPAAPLRQPPTTDLGTMAVIPVEILHVILQYCDIQSMAYFRGLNRWAADVVDALPQYRILRRHAANLGRAYHAVSAPVPSEKYNKEGASPTLQQHRLCSPPVCAVVSTLYEPRCDGCYLALGTFFHLPSGSRICIACLNPKGHPTEPFYKYDTRFPRRQFSPITAEMAERELGLPQEVFKTLPGRMRVLPGTYGEVSGNNANAGLVTFEAGDGEGKAVEGWEEMVDHHIVVPAALEAHGSAIAWATWLVDRVWLERERTVPQDRDEQVVRREEVLRYAAVVRVPVLRGLGEAVSAEWGFPCPGCKNGEGADGNGNLRYTRETLMPHIKKFGKVKGGKHVKDDNV